MKATELMIGDWIEETHYSIQPRRELRKITDQDFITSGVKIEPIPLTVEIMKKNNYDAGQVSWWEDDDKIHIFMETNTMEIEGMFYSVHELQHALRLCGLTELADNFKV